MSKLIRTKQLICFLNIESKSPFPVTQVANGDEFPEAFTLAEMVKASVRHTEGPEFESSPVTFSFHKNIINLFPCVVGFTNDIRNFFI